MKSIDCKDCQGLVEYVPPPTTPDISNLSYAKRCMELDPSYTNPIIDCDKVYTTWNGKGTADTYEWHIGIWHNVEPDPTLPPIWQFETFQQKYGLEVIFTCIPPGDWTIVLVTKLGTCPNTFSHTPNATTGNITNVTCFSCGTYNTPVMGLIPVVMDCGGCCVKLYDKCNLKQV